MELFSYYRSSTAYRVRIVLNLKGIDYGITPINLLKGEEKNTSYRQIHPQGLVPALRLDNGQVVTQSSAIIEYLEECYPEPSLLASHPLERAQQRAMMALIASDIHPVNNIRVLKYLQKHCAVDDIQKSTWYKHWIVEGFQALERQLQGSPFACGEQISLVDAYLIPQVFNALRFGVAMDDYPKIFQIWEDCNQLEAFIRAAPEHQPDNAAVGGG